VINVTYLTVKIVSFPLIPAPVQSLKVRFFGPTLFILYSNPISSLSLNTPSELSTTDFCWKLSDERYTYHIQFEFWLLRWLTPAVTDRLPSVLRCQQSVPSVWSTMQCSNVSAAHRLLLAASYICLVTFLFLYYVIVSFSPTVPLSISLDTVLSHNYRITLVIKVSRLLIISRFSRRLTAE